VTSPDLPDTDSAEEEEELPQPSLEDQVAEEAAEPGPDA
jgi:hypothetical protein